jgi:hypothetical protein
MSAMVFAVLAVAARFDRNYIGKPWRAGPQPHDVTGGAVAITPLIWRSVVAWLRRRRPAMPIGIVSARPSELRVLMRRWPAARCRRYRERTGEPG